MNGKCTQDVYSKPIKKTISSQRNNTQIIQTLPSKSMVLFQFTTEQIPCITQFTFHWKQSGLINVRISVGCRYIGRPLYYWQLKLGIKQQPTCEICIHRRSQFKATSLCRLRPPKVPERRRKTVPRGDPSSAQNEAKLTRPL